MSKRNLYTLALACIGAVGAAAAPAKAALTWTGEHTADANTIALYHFNEGTGSATFSSTTNSRPQINLNLSSFWSTDTGWLGTQTGRSLSNVNATNNGMAYNGSMGVTAGNQTIDWGLPGISISFWMKDPVDMSRNNVAIDLGEDGWQNLQSSFGYRSDYLDATLRHDGVGAPNRPVGQSPPYNFVTTVSDGQWHHVALVVDNATDWAVLYVDNVLQQLGVDGNGNPIMGWSTNTAQGLEGPVSEIMTIGNFAGYIDELLIQGEVMTDFSNAINVPEPGSLSLIGLAGLAVLKRRRAAR
jgi:hypothetical protein